MEEQRHARLTRLQARLEYVFAQPDTLDTALTHTSYVKGDGKGAAHNERLEYLGDAVLELCVSEEIFRRYPDWDEGDMTRARAAIVCESALNEIAREKLGLQEYLLLGHGEENTGGKNKPSIVSDAFEAVIGAMYLDGGIEQARAFIARVFEEAFSRVERASSNKDYKTALQEYVQKRHLGRIAYVLKDESGPDHKKQFHMQVFIDDMLRGEGEGGSKQEAGQRAAAKAFIAIGGKK